ncbi:MAG: lysophospholipid acyltransferase family protein [Brevefilum sp.]
MDTLISHLSDSLIDEILAAVGLPITRLTHAVLWRAFHPVTDRLAYLGSEFDQITKAQGLAAASAWALTHFCDGVQVHGDKNIPESGPLLVVSNHPGTYDALALFSNLPGHAIRCVSNAIPFLNRLPHARDHFLFAPRDNARERMLVLRNAIRHLREGGTLVYFASGHRDPDPAVYPGAERAFDQWLNVFDTFFEYVKNLRVLPTVVSGVVSAAWAVHPITWLRRAQIDKQRLAEFGQVISQLRKPGQLMLAPRISFGPHFIEHDLRQVFGDGVLFGAVVERVKTLFRQSSAYFGDFFQG